MWFPSCFNCRGNWREWWAAKAKSCEVVIPMISPSFFASNACRAELTFAVNNRKYIAPVLVEPFSECPPDMEMLLQGHNRIPSGGCFNENFDDNMCQLIAAICTNYCEPSLKPTNKSGAGY